MKVNFNQQQSTNLKSNPDIENPDKQDKEKANPTQTATI